MDPSNSPPPNSDGTSPPQANNRGRRPALIPYTDDLAALFAAGNYSPTSLGGNSATNGKAPLFVLPPLLPDGENPSMMVLPPPTWNGVELEDDTTACDWDSDDSEDESLQENREGRKAELRRSGAGLGDSDAMEVDEEDVREVEGDVASWLNDSPEEQPIDNATGPGRRPLNRHKLQLSATRPEEMEVTDDKDGTYTVPTSPMSGNFGEELDMQRKRLEAAGILSMEGIQQS